MRKRLGRKLIYHCFYILAIILVLFTNFFSEDLSILLRLKPHIYKSSATQVHFIDVGQGDSIAVKLSNGKTMLIDSGIEL